MAEDIGTVTSIVIDKVQVTAFGVTTHPPEKAAISIMYAVGHNDAAGNFVPVEYKSRIIQGGEFLEVVGALPDGNITLYENIKAALYSKLR